MKNYKVTIRKMEFPTDGNRTVKAVARLTKTLKYGKIEFDALVLNSIKDVFDHRLGKGAKIDIEVNDEGQVKLLNFYPTKDKILMPVACNSCGNTLKGLKDKPDLFCDNLFCKASDRASIHILLSLVSDDLNLIEAYLNTFPLKSGHTRINNLYEYLIHFKDVGMKNTETREKMFSNLNAINEKEIYDLLEIERKLEVILSEKHDNSFYWNIFNIPNFKISELEKLNPARITTNQLGQIKSTVKRNTLINGKKYFQTMMKLFKSMEK